MNLAFKYPTILWNCACLISDAGGNEKEIEEEEEEEDLNVEETYTNEVENFIEESEEDEENEDDEEVKADKKKKKAKATNYGKIATAIGRFKASGINISAPDINSSTYTFSPDIKNNLIRYGLSGITRIGDNIIEMIINNRPFTSLEDFLKKVKINKPQMINLIKAGAFDVFGDRIEIMHQYINIISDAKKRITLQNMKMLIDFGLIPEEYDMERRVFNFNKYIKKSKHDNVYDLDNIAFNFIDKYFDIDNLIPSETESGFSIKQTDWDKIYKKHMDKIRPWVQANNKILLDQVNNRLTQEVWNKYCTGTVSKWEMDAISCYIHEHELTNLQYDKYGLDKFSELSETPVIDRFIPIKGKMIPIYKLSRICGVVLDRDKSKKTVTLLTTDAVVTVKIYGVFAEYDKQISEVGADGHKHVTRKSEFSRGNKIIITGIREENSFCAKKYSKTPFHLIETIESIDENGNIKINNRND